jgi:genome maintenance exonuclease 1
MVDLIQVLIKRKYKYEPLTRVDGDGGRKYIYGDTRLPSVTTILSGTKDQSHLDDWVKRVGQEQADKIKNDASIVGTHLHSVIERMVLGRSLPPPKNWLMCKGYEMGYRIVNTYFEHLSEIWGSEVMLYYPEKYAGTTDLVGVYRGKPCIIDFKQTNKMKKREWIEDYFHQLAAYALAHDIVHGTEINTGVVLMASQQGGTEEFITCGREFESYKAQWLARVEKFASQAQKPDSVEE